MAPLTAPEDDAAELAGETQEDIAESQGSNQQLPGLPPMVGQDGKPLFVPIKKAKDGA